MPKISIIIPVYKAEAFLARCMDSIFAQTFTDYEVILVDDGSPDKSGVMCDEYAAQDARVRVIHQENSGQAVARNRALDIAKGEYIAFVDSDDWVHPRYLEILLSHAQQHHAAISVCGHRKTEIVVPHEAVQEDAAFVYIGKEFVRKGLLGEMENHVWLLWDKLFHRDCFATVRMPEGRINEDNAIVYKMLYEADTVVCTEEPLYYYFQNENSTVNRAFHRKHLDWLLVPEEMIAYFTEKGDKVLLDKANRMYLTELANMLRKVKTHLPDKTIERDLLKKLRRQYRIEKKKYPITMKTHPQVLELLYPRLTWCYWTMKRLGG